MRMNRRGFLGGLGAAALAAPVSQAAALSSDLKSAPPARMKLGTQFGSDANPGDDVLRTLAALGVNHICGALPSPRFDEKWTVESLTRAKERIESFGLTLDMLPLPLSSHPIRTAEYPNIMLGKSPERDRDIDEICQMIHNTSRAGVPALKYNLTILGVVRTESTTGRGGSRYSTFDYAAAKQDTLTEAGKVTEDMMWERITYFLDRVVPVATEYKVRIACHPHDPGMPRDTGFRGVNRVLGSVDGLKRFVAIQQSPYHGLNFCQGTVSEMLKNPGTEIFDVIRYFGTRKKIFNVHFRNIRGGFLKFQETFPDDGDVNMLEALRVYKEVGYDGMMMPDHAPDIAGDAEKKQAFAFAYGYIRGLLQAVGAQA
jgi:mannonate dehydratase